MTRPVIQSSGNTGPQAGTTAALADGKSDRTARIKTLYRIMQSVEVRRLSLCSYISNT